MSEKPEEMPDKATDEALVTFALLAYNQEEYIREAVEGAFAQTYSPLEIILSDDCSSDKTYEIMQAMAVAYKGSHNVSVRKTKRNSGVFNHFMEVCKIARGKIFVVAAGDDISIPERTVRLVQSLKSNIACAAAYSITEQIDEKGANLGCFSPPERESRDFVQGGMLHLLGCSAAYITQHLTNIAPFKSKAIAEDAFMSHVLQLAGFGVCRVDRPLVRYRVSQNNLSILRTHNSGFQAHLELEDRKIRRLVLNANTYAAIATHGPQLAARLVQETRPLKVAAIQKYIAKLRVMVDFYEMSFPMRVVQIFSLRHDLEAVRFLLPRMFGRRVFYMLFRAFSEAAFNISKKISGYR
ncbi:glycosyltransferase family 2 protein [Amylibacter sp.]|nr:glycosyltransferase family 2 protein [Amylibacter sp.]